MNALLLLTLVEIFSPLPIGWCKGTGSILNKKAATAASIHAATKSLSVSLQRGFPLTSDGEIVGTIGVGSGTPEQDVGIAQAGVLALGTTIAKNLSPSSNL